MASNFANSNIADKFAFYSYTTKSGKVVETYIPRTFKQLDNSEARIPLKTLDRVAKESSEIIVMVEELYGKGTVTYNGSLHAASRNFTAQTTKFWIKPVIDAVKKVSKILSHQGFDAAFVKKTLGYHYEYREFFTIDPSQDSVKGFEGKENSPVRNGAMRTLPEILERYDSAGYTSDYNPAHLTLHETIWVLEQTKQYAIEVLESVDVEATPGNISNFLIMSEIKNDKFLKTFLAKMPFLNRHAEIDRNIAGLIGEGLNFEKVFMIEFAKVSFATEEELYNIIALPTAWMAKILFGSPE